MMKLIVKAAGAVCAVVAVVAVSAWADQATDAGARQSRAYLNSYNIASRGVALEGYCPVAYFAVNKPVMGKPEYAATHKGVTYHFVSADAKMMFEGDPEKYIPAFGGWCAFGMSVKDKFPIDPHKFKIVDGRLMVFLNNPNIDAMQLWDDGDEKVLVAKADAHGRTVSQ